MLPVLAGSRIMLANRTWPRRRLHRCRRVSPASTSSALAIAPTAHFGRNGPFLRDQCAFRALAADGTLQTAVRPITIRVPARPGRNRKEATICLRWRDGSAPLLVATAAAVHALRVTGTAMASAATTVIAAVVFGLG